ncbi:hypothetical protein ES703_31218 [subsurface metagenome]
MITRNGLRVRHFFSTKCVGRRVKVSRHPLPRKKLVLVFLSALLLIMAGLFESCDLFETSQEWVLVNQMGDAATVTAPAGSCTSTFTETSNSNGWYVYIPGMNSIRLTVGGSISGANWRFVGLTGSGPQVNCIGNGVGTADAAFPSGNSVSGTVTINTQSPLGATSGTGSWSGSRTK